MGITLLRLSVMGNSTSVTLLRLSVMGNNTSGCHTVVTVNDGE